MCAWHCTDSRVSKIRSDSHKNKPCSQGLSDSIREQLRAISGVRLPGHGGQREEWQVLHEKRFTSQSFPNSALLPDRDYLLSQRPDENSKSELRKYRMFSSHIFVAEN